MVSSTRLIPDGGPDALQAALDASGVVGMWTHDVWADRFVVSPALAEAMGLDPAGAAAGVSVSAFLDRTHGEDRARVENALHVAVEGGDPFEIAFRTLRGPRWLVLRGRIGRDAAGRVAQGHGIAIDHTEERAGLQGARSQEAVNRMAEHAIALRGLAAGLQQPALATLLDSLMLEIGFALARTLREAGRGREH